MTAPSTSTTPPAPAPADNCARCGHPRLDHKRSQKGCTTAGCDCPLAFWDLPDA